MASKRTLALKVLICGLSCWSLSATMTAQRYNFNVGGGPGFPLSQTSNFANLSYNFVSGGGVNLSPHAKFVGEFMFHGLPIKQSVLNELQVPSGKGRLYSVTGNLLIGTGSARKSLYLIGGGGWYRRTVEAQKTVYQQGEVCAPVVVWWNIQCVNGIFPTDVTIASNTTSAGGFNIGGGFTIAFGESRANFYTEVRYHQAFTKNIDTTVLPVTFGVRF